jgi:hypothetical protein
VFVHPFSLAAQGLDGDSVRLFDEFICYRFKLFQDGGGCVKPRGGRKILQIAREIAGDGRKLREQTATFVGRFAQSRGVLVTQRVPECGQMFRDARNERLAHFLEESQVAPAGGQQHRRVEQVRPAGLAG